jgi:hypothetical protein
MSRAKKVGEWIWQENEIELERQEDRAGFSRRGAEESREGQRRVEKE